MKRYFFQFGNNVVDNSALLFCTAATRVSGGDDYDANAWCAVHTPTIFSVRGEWRCVELDLPFAIRGDGDTIALLDQKLRSNGFFLAADSQTMAITDMQRDQVHLYWLSSVMLLLFFIQWVYLFYHQERID